MIKLRNNVVNIIIFWNSNNNRQVYSTWCPMTPRAPTPLPLPPSVPNKQASIDVGQVLLWSWRGNHSGCAWLRRTPETNQKVIKKNLHRVLHHQSLPIAFTSVWPASKDRVFGFQNHVWEGGHNPIKGNFHQWPVPSRGYDEMEKKEKLK